MVPKQKKLVNIHNTIPQDLCFSEILPRLPAKSIVRFKSVSKQWNSLILSPHFANSRIKLCKYTNLLIQSGRGFPCDPFILFNLKLDRNNFKLSALNHHPNNKFMKASQGEVYLIGTYHGLICYYDSPKFYISNPTVQKLCSIPPDLSWGLQYNFNRRYNDLLIQVAGFGYDSSTDDYKIVFLSRLNDCCGYLFALKNSTWKKLDMSWYSNRNTNTDYSWLTCYLPRGIAYPIQINDTLHWLLHFNMSRPFIVFLVFDLAKELFSIIDLPSQDDDIIGITQIRGCLCKLHYQSGNGQKKGRKSPRLELQMLEKYGVWDTWKTFYVCDLGMRIPRDYLNFFEFRDDDCDDKIFILKNIQADVKNPLRIHFIDSESFHQPSQVVFQGYRGPSHNFWLKCAYSFTENFIWPSYFSDRECEYSLTFS